MSESPMTPNAARRYEVSTKDLPLCCPMPVSRLWDSHPRVYLPIEETGTAVCPYCDAVYVLVDAPADVAANHD